MQQEEYKLTTEQLNFLNENGYLVLKKLIPEELCDKVVEEMFEKAQDHFKIKKNKESSWKASLE